MLTLLATLAFSFSLPSGLLRPTHSSPAACVRMSEEVETNPLSGEPLTGGLWAKLKFRGPGPAMMFYLEDFRSEFAAVDADNDGFIGEPELSALMKNIGKEISDEEVTTMMKSIETDLGVTRDSSGAPLIFAEQWAKATLDLLRAELNKDKPTGFKFPWQ